MQVTVACRSGMFRGGDERAVALGIERARQGGLLDPCDPRALQLAEIQLADLAAAAATTRSRRPISTASPAAASRRRLRLRRFAELRGASHRGDRDRNRAPPPRPFRWLLPARARRPRARRRAARRDATLAGRAGHASTSASASWTRRRSARPALCAIADRISGCRKRIVCRSASTMPASAAGATASRSTAVAGHGGARREDLVESVLVAQRRHEQEQASRFGKLRSRGRQTRARGARSTARRRPPQLVLAAADRRRQLEEGERVSGRLVQHARTRARPRELRRGRVEQRCGRRVVQRGQPVLRQARFAERRGVAIADGDQQRRSGRTRSAARRTRARRRSARSSQWASSTITRSGASAATSESEVEHGHRDPEVLGRRLVRRGRKRRRARLAAASRSSLARSRTGRSSWCRPANGRCVSDCTPVVVSTAMPRSRACARPRTASATCRCRARRAARAPARARHVVEERHQELLLLEATE